MKKIIVLGIFISMMACNKKNVSENQNLENNAKSKETITASLRKMYDAEFHNQYPLEDTLIFSKEIVKLNSQCDSVTKADTERIAKSNYPLDKPFLREGSRVSALQEGVTDFKITEIKTISDRTEVNVTLSNKNYPELKPWNERVVFINQNGLKIDNIYFKLDKEASASNYSTLKKTLVSFIKQADGIK